MDFVINPQKTPTPRQYGEIFLIHKTLSSEGLNPSNLLNTLTHEDIYWHFQGRDQELIGVGDLLKLHPIKDEEKIKLLQDQCPQLKALIWAPFEQEDWDRDLIYLIPKHLFVFAEERVDLYQFSLEPNNFEKLYLQAPKSASSKKILIGTKQTPIFAKWDQQIHQAKELFRTEKLKKVILSGRSEFYFDQEINATELYTQIKDSIRSTYSIFLHKQGKSFISFSPETLFHWRQQILSIDVLAGTRARGKTPEEDLNLEMELLSDPKEIKEHQWVIDSIEGPLKEMNLVPEFKFHHHVKKLNHVQHIHGQLFAHCPDNPLVQGLLNLHPTGAIGGFPKAQAVAAIQSLESEKRGPYCGVLGIASKDDIDISVNIRCASIIDNCLCAYAGAGIVEDSESEKEWKEIHHKMENFRSFLIQ